MSRDAEIVSKNMKSIHSRDTSIELRLRKALWKKGYRYRKNYKKLPGTPDIVLTCYKIAIFCDSEFWHGYDWEHRKGDFKKHREFWIRKIERNIERDKEVNEKLQAEGWTVLRFWGREIKHDLETCVMTIEQCLMNV